MVPVFARSSNAIVDIDILQKSIEQRAGIVVARKGRQQNDSVKVEQRTQHRIFTFIAEKQSNGALSLQEVFLLTQNAAMIASEFTEDANEFPDQRSSSPEAAPAMIRHASFVVEQKLKLLHPDLYAEFNQKFTDLQ